MKLMSKQLSIVVLGGSQIHVFENYRFRTYALIDVLAMWSSIYSLMGLPAQEGYLKTVYKRFLVMAFRHDQTYAPLQLPDFRQTN